MTPLARPALPCLRSRRRSSVPAQPRIRMPSPSPLHAVSRATLAAALACLSSACTDSGDGGGGGRGAWKTGQEWRLVQEARIGSAGEDGPGAFGNVIEVAIDPMGRIWVADALRHQIQVFDARGEHVRSVGRKGAGPGEFGGISGMAWAPDGTLWVLDDGNARFALYDTAGTLLRTRVRDSNTTVSPWPGRLDRRARLYDVAADVQPDATFRHVVVRFDSAGLPRDTFRLPEFRPEVFSITRGDSQNRRITEVSVPFTGNQQWAIDQEGYVWIANTARYRLERHAFGGGVERVVERRTPGVPVTREERDRMLENYRDFTRQGGRIDVSRIPDHHPAMNGFLFDDAGHLWVSVVTSPREGRALDVFDPIGRFLGRVALPAPQRTALRAVRGDRMALVFRDSLDVPTVIVMRIHKPRG